MGTGLRFMSQICLLLGPDQPKMARQLGKYRLNFRAAGRAPELSHPLLLILESDSHGRKPGNATPPLWSHASGTLGLSTPSGIRTSRMPPDLDPSHQYEGKLYLT